MSKFTIRNFSARLLGSSETLNSPFPQLFEAVAEGNMHCYCLLQLTTHRSNSSEEHQDFIVYYANKKLLSLLRSPEKLVLGKSLSGIYPFSENWIQCNRYFDALRLGRPIFEEFPLQVFEQTRWYRHEIVPISNELLSVTAEDITERRLLEKELLRSAYSDELTGLKNRSALLQFLESINEKNDRITLVLLDIENFRSINRCFGLEAANHLLVCVAERLRHLEEGTAYRISANTFALVIARREHEVSLGEVILRKWLNQLSGDCEFEGKLIPCPLRAGYSYAGSNNRGKVDLLIDEAEVALSEAKTCRDRSIVQYSGAVEQSHQLRLSIGVHLPEALASKTFFPVFQPQYSLVTGEVVGFEALCRWKHIEFGFVSPEIFVRVAEQMNLLKSLDLQLLTQVVADINEMPVQKLRLSLSVNASPSSIQDSRYVDGLLELSKLLPSWCFLEIELTENALISDDESLKHSMLRLQQQGVSIALDDFGSGYSNLSYLASFPFEKLKLDRCLISGLENNARSADLVSGMIDLAHRLGLKVVAEGIESEPQLNWLRSAGCDVGQGYLLSKPLPQSESRRFFQPVESLLALS